MAEDTPFGPTVTPEQQFTSQFLSDQFATFSAPLSNTPTTMETAGAIWRQETILGSLFDIGVREEKSIGGYVFDKSFNPLAFAKENEESYSDVLPFIYSGEFNDVWSPEQFEARATRYRKELEDRRIMQEGTTAGMVVGMGLSFLDLTTLIPVVGLGSKVTAAGKAVRLGAYGAGVTAGQEAVLHSLRDQRTMMESVYGIAAGGLFGGTLGAISGVLSKQHVLHPENPNNPLRDDAPPNVVVARPGDADGDAVSIRQEKQPDGTSKTVIHSLRDDPQNTAYPKRDTRFDPEPDQSKVIEASEGPSTAGAAQVKAVEAPKVLNIGRAGRALAKVIPKLRMLMSPVSGVRATMQKLSDTGGVILESMGTGGSPGRTATDIKASLELGYTEFAIGVKEKAGVLIAKIGGPSSRAGLTLQEAKTDALRFVEDVGKAATGEQRQKIYIKDDGHLEEEEIAALVRMTAMRYNDANPISKLNVDKLEARFGVDNTKTILAAAKDMADDVHAYNKKMEQFLRDTLEVPDDQLLGKDYVMAHIYLRDAVAADRAGFEEILLRKFLDEPTEEFLNDIEGFGGAITPDEFAALGKQDITINGIEYTTKTGLAAKVDILESWSGDVYERALLEAEINLDIALQVAKDSRREAVLAAGDAKKTDTEIKNGSIKEAVAVLKNRQNDQITKKTELKNARDKKTKLDTEIKSLEEEQKIRMGIFHETGKYKKRAQSQVAEAEGLLKELEDMGDQALAQDVSAARNLLTEADLRLADPDQILEEAVKASASKKVYGRVLDTLRERQRLIDKEIKKNEIELNDLNIKAGDLQKAVDNAQNALENLKAKRKALTARRKETTRQAGKDKTAAKKAKKIARAKGKDAPVHEYVKRLVSDIASGNRLPGSIDAVESSMSNRLKKRQITWTNDELDELFDRGFMSDDLFGTMDVANRELSALIGLKQTFGTTDTIKIVNDAVAAVDEKIRDPNISDRYKRQLQTHAKDVKESMTGMLDEYMGRAGPKPTDNNLVNTLAWSADKLRKWAYSVYGPGFMVGSMTDFAQKALVNGFHADSALLMRNAADMFRDVSKSELRTIVAHLENMMQNNRALSLANIEQERLPGALGQQGSRTYAATNLVSRAANSLSNSVSIWSGMQWWNTRGKLTALNAMQHHLVKDIGDYEAVLAKATAGDLKAQKLIAKYASFDLGRENMALIKKMIDKYPPVNNKGVFELDWHRWHQSGPEGDEAVKSLTAAMMRNANQAITTPGLGEKPLFMSNPVFKTIFQFQTFGFVSVPKTILPAIQRGMNYKDAELLLYMGYVSALGSMVLVAKDLIRDGEVKERTETEWAYDIFDRAGFTNYLSQPTAAVWAAVTSMAGYPSTPGRYGNAPISGLLGGPGLGVADRLATGVRGAFEGDINKAADNLRKMLPYKQVFDVMSQLGEE